METPQIRACTNCVRAKAKCSTTNKIDAQGQCERCYRMKKVCQPSPPVRRQRTLKKSSAQGISNSKLEEKLDGLVTLLKSATQGAPGILDPTLINSSLESLLSSANSDSTPGLTATSGIRVGDPNGGLSPHERRPPGPSYISVTSSSSQATPLNIDNSRTFLPPALEPTQEEAEIRLNCFRSNYIPRLPLIVISPDVTASQLRQERPLLWTSIITVTAKNSTQQILLSKEMRAILSREAFIEGTRNMDLLLATLVFSTWDRRFPLGKPIIICMIQLGIGIMYDLGLDKAPSPRDLTTILTYDLKGDVAGPPGNRTMEERRALLGCFLMSSVYAGPCSILRKGSSLRWTSYSNECLQVLETQKEFESDALLVQLVKLRLIFERVNELHWSSSSNENNIPMKAPAEFYLRSLETSLQDLKSKIPRELLNNESLLMELYSTELSIYEVGLSPAPNIFSGQLNRRIECLWTCVSAIQSWVSVFFNMPPAQLIGLSAPIYTSMVRVVVGMQRLAIFEHSEWDRMLFREQIDILGFLERGANLLSQVKEAAGLDIGGSEDSDTFTNLANKVRSLKGLWVARISSTMNSMGVAGNYELYDFPMEFSDEDWLRDLLGD